MSTYKKPDYMDEITKPFDVRTAMEEASCCLLCYDAPCSRACPAGTDPGSFIMSLRFRNEKGAAETIRTANPLGGVCARVCPYDRLCEEACSRCGIDKPIQIGRLQRYAADLEAVYGMNVMETGKSIHKKVACIGAGPASLACAAILAQNGVDVTIYEKKARAGGLLSYGILPSRLPQSVVDHEIALIEKLGVTIRCGVTIGRDIAIEEIRKNYDALFIGTGLDRAKSLDIPGSGLKGVTSALDFLADMKEADGKGTVGRHVVVIGGGDVAMDAACTAALLGAQATIVYRRTLEEAPANTKEIAFAQSLGISFLFRFRPEEITGDGTKAEGLRAVGVGHDSVITLQADQVILAIGQEAADDLALPLERDGRKLIAAQNGATSIPGIFAGGDIVNGGKTVVQAVAEGKLAAHSILQYMEGEK